MRPVHGRREPRHYDLGGRRVATLAEGSLPAGITLGSTAARRAARASHRVCFVRISRGAEHRLQRLVLMP